MFMPLRISRRFFCDSIKKTKQKIYVSGIQPTGVPHIGNYLGFIQNFVQQQDEANALKYLFIADLHSIALGFLRPEQLRNNVFTLAAMLIACGVDVEKTILFQQSRIAEHTELSWILGGFQTITALQRIPQYKDKSQGFKNGAVPLNLMSYPVLQAADVLIYNATHIAVGEDQNQHINIILSRSPRVRSLKDPTKKMSKTETTDWSRILLSDFRETIHAKCKRATTDSIGTITYDPVERLAISNLISLHAIFADKTIDEIVEMCKEMNTVQFKESLFKSIEIKVAPIRAKFENIKQNQKEYVDDVLEYGYSRAKLIASKNLEEIKNIVGFN